MAENNAYSTIVGGFFEGLLAPILELIIALIVAGFMTTFESLQSITGASTVVLSYSEYIALIGLIDILRNVLFNVLHPGIATGNVLGSICGIFLFYSVIVSASPDAAGSVLITTVILFVSWLLGVYVWYKKTINNT